MTWSELLFLFFFLFFSFLFLRFNLKTETETERKRKQGARKTGRVIFIHKFEILYRVRDICGKHVTPEIQPRAG